MKNVHNEQRFDLDADEFINKATNPILDRPNMIKKKVKPSLNTQVIMQQSNSPSTNPDEGSSLISDEDTPGSTPVKNCGPSEHVTFIKIKPQLSLDILQTATSTAIS